MFFVVILLQYPIVYWKRLFAVKYLFICPAISPATHIVASIGPMHRALDLFKIKQTIEMFDIVFRMVWIVSNVKWQIISHCCKINSLNKYGTSIHFEWWFRYYLQMNFSVNCEHLLFYDKYVTFHIHSYPLLSC